MAETIDIDQLSVEDFLFSVGAKSSKNFNGQFIRDSMTKIAIFRILCAICCNKYDLSVQKAELVFSFKLQEPCELSSIDFLLLGMLVTDFTYDSTFFEITQQNCFKYTIQTRSRVEFKNVNVSNF